MQGNLYLINFFLIFNYKNHERIHELYQLYESDQEEISFKKSIHFFKKSCVQTNP